MSRCVKYCNSPLRFSALSIPYPHFLCRCCFLESSESLWLKYIEHWSLAALTARGSTWNILCSHLTSCSLKRHGLLTVSAFANLTGVDVCVLSSCVEDRDSGHKIFKASFADFRFNHVVINDLIWHSIAMAVFASSPPFTCFTG